MNIDELEQWAAAAMQTLQEICDDAQQAVGNPEGEDQLTDVRALMADYERIASGLPTWQTKILRHETAYPELHEPPGANELSAITTRLLKKQAS